MRNYILLFISLMVFSCGGKSQTVSTQNGSTVSENITQSQLDSIAKYSIPFPDSTQLSIALVHDTVVTFLGVLKEKETLHAIENFRSVFEIGSITKVFTSTLLSHLVSEERVSLDDPIQKHLSMKLHDKGKDVNALTLKHLANHTSGLPRLPENFFETVSDPANPYKDYDQETLEKYLKEALTLNQLPGHKYEYSNLGVGVLGYLLAKISDKSYEELLQEKIFIPLKMSNSSTERERLHAHLVAGRDGAGNQVPNWDLNALQSAGAMLSTTEDLVKFVKANFEKNPVYAIQKQKTFRVDKNMAVALGWHISMTENGEEWYWHNGGTGGYRSSLVCNMNNKTGIVILSNVSAFNKHMSNIDQLCFSLMKSIEY